MSPKTSAERSGTTRERVTRPDFTVFWRPAPTDARPVSLHPAADSEGGSITVTRTSDRAKK